MNVSTSDTINTASGSSEAEALAYPGISKLSFGLLFAILAVTAALYSTTIGDYFLGDDFIHLPWLLKASHDPSIVLKDFTTSWLGVSYVQFYRPLVTVSMFVDYSIWGPNGVGFHISNLIYHLVSTVAVFLIVRNVNRAACSSIVPSEDGDSLQLKRLLTSDFLPLASAAIFGTYAAHPEVVCWILGRTDGLCSMFVLLSIWCYTQAQFFRSSLWTVFTCLALALGLCSKEMAIPTPALFFVFSMLFFHAVRPKADADTKALSLVALFGQSFKHAFFATSPYWLMAVVYFGVRRFALGTFVGGYDNSLSLGFSFPDLVAHWCKALSYFVIPTNLDVISPRSPIRYIWSGSIIINSILALVFARSRLALLKVLGFCTMWLVLCFVPIFRNFTLTETLQGGRLVYLASAPFAVLITIGWVSLVFAGRIQKAISIAVLAGMLAISSYFLWVNNSVWVEAGAQSKAIETRLHELYADHSGDPLRFFCGIPNELHGAWLGINAFEGMTKQPRMPRSLEHASCLIPADRVTPFGFLRDDFGKLGTDAQIYRWDTHSKDFHLITLPQNDDHAYESWQRIDFKDSHGEPLNLIAAPSKPGQSAKLEIDFSGKHLQCYNANVLNIGATVLSRPEQSAPQFARLRYKNDLEDSYDEGTEELHLMLPTLGQQPLIFPMRENSNWWLGGECRKLRLEFPPGWCVRIDGISAEYGATSVPKFTFNEPAKPITLGVGLLKPSVRSINLKYDAQNIPAAKRVVLERTRVNFPFETHNASGPSLATEKTYPLPALAGDLKIDDTMADAPGIYQFRIRALNSNGTSAGFASDHAVVMVMK